MVRFLLPDEIMSTLVALVSSEPNVELVHYLEQVGFGVSSFRSFRNVPRHGTLVWLVDPLLDDEAVLGSVDAWLGTSTRLRAVVVSDRPARLGNATKRARDRVVHLPSPVFGWQLIDALRDGGGRV